MTVSFSGKKLTLNGRAIELPWPVLAAVEHGEKTFVLLDPDVYLVDPQYKALHARGVPALRNLLAIGEGGEILWEGNLPEAADYYYKITSVAPLTVSSFSSYSCEIDPNSGKIIRRVFFK
jgi:hypothetical protein